MIYSDEYWIDVKRILPNIVDKEALYNKRILLTGATGMLVSAVLDTLCLMNRECGANIEIILASRTIERVKRRFSHLKEGTDYHWIYFDTTEEREFQIDIDYIIHGASNANPTLYALHPAETIMGNIVGTNSLLKLLAKNQKGRMLFISSSEIYGKTERGCEYKEEDYGVIDSMNLRAGYPNAKKLAETLCVSYKSEYDVDVVVARPGHIYGPSITDKDDRASAQFTKAAAEGNEIVLKSAGLQRRSYCYTLDCASAILSILTRGKSGEAYNIANKNSNITIRELAEEFAECVNRKVRYENPSDIEEKGYNLMSNSALNAEKLEALGWKAEFGFSEGIARTIKFYK